MVVGVVCRWLAGERLAATPDARSLAVFPAGRRAAGRLRLPDLPRPVVKLLGAGEYLVEPQARRASFFIF